jgi:predicted nucleic acid-binding protein
MDIVADASAFLAVVLNEDDREWVLNKTAGKSIASPEILHYEIGNALIALQKKRRLNEREVVRAFRLSMRIPVTLLPVKIDDSLKIAMQFNIYAYDSYYLQCCIENNLSLVSIDDRMCNIAKNLGIEVLE